MKLIGITGWKNTGKTGLVERLVAQFIAEGLRVSTLKHAHHGFDPETPGADSFRHREAGATEVLVATSERWALMSELRGAPEPSLDDLLARLAPVDLVIAEGWKTAEHPKIECWRAGTPEPPRATADPTILAVASDVAPDVPCPVLPLDDTTAIAALIRRELDL
ncbi:molybdopterin-guanine dinucleotide biosynthesis protein B [Rhodobacterales bacterium HKCCE3408]|nr:molybdopterin-guanine dinucleotide biosynthesis protein B [Rhodobacterales bacterium HKCCE3408]